MKLFIFSALLSAAQANFFRHHHRGIKGFLGAGKHHKANNFHAVISLAQQSDFDLTKITYYTCNSTQTTAGLCMQGTGVAKTNIGQTTSCSVTSGSSGGSPGPNTCSYTSSSGSAQTGDVGNSGCSAGDVQWCLDTNTVTGLNLYNIEYIPTASGNHIVMEIDANGQTVVEEYYHCDQGHKPDANGDCQPCDAGEFAVLGATTCTKCPPGEFATGTGNSACTACGAGSITDTGNQAGATTCTVCSANTYSLNSGVASCTACPLNSYTVGAATTDHDNVNDCYCSAGYHSTQGVTTNAGACQQCPVDTFQGLGDEVGTSGHNSDNACTSCPQNSGTQSGTGKNAIDDCVCNAGYRNTGQLTCTACLNDYFLIQADVKSVTNQSQTCTQCPQNSGHFDTASSSQDDCLCDPGYASGNAACSICNQNTYKNTATSVNTVAQCTSCPQNSGTQQQGEISESACLCSAGFKSTGGNGNTAGCQTCPADYFSAGNVAVDAGSDCTQCPDGSDTASATGSDDISDCKCPTGTKATGTGCQTCPVNQYNAIQDPVSPATDCDSCPANSGTLSTTGQDAVTDCSCNNGYESDVNTNTCSQCPTNEFNDDHDGVGTTGTCEDCPTGKVSPAGSTQSSDCKYQSQMYGYAKMLNTTAGGGVCADYCISWLGDLYDDFTTNDIQSESIVQLESAGADSALCALLKSSGHLIKQQGC